MKKMVICLMGLMLVVGCATTDGGKSGPAPSPAKTRFLEGYYDKLTPGPEGGAKLRWLKAGADFKKYDKVMLDSVVFFLSEDSEYFGIDPHQLKELADGFNRQLVAALKDKYPIVSDPGPGVLRIRLAITELKQSRPAISAVTSVVPVGIGVSLLKKGVTDSWTGSGATGAELMALDSGTQEVIAVAKDDRSAGFTERFSKWGSAEEAFKFWAERVRLFLDQAHGMKN